MSFAGICGCTFVCLCIRTLECFYLLFIAFTHVFMHPCMHVCTHIQVQLYMCVHMHVSVYIDGCK